MRRAHGHVADLVARITQLRLQCGDLGIGRLARGFCGLHGLLRSGDGRAAGADVGPGAVTRRHGSVQLLARGAAQLGLEQGLLALGIGLGAGCHFRLRHHRLGGNHFAP